MNISKLKCRVHIVCSDNTSIKGYIFLNEGERLLDFINDTRENFIAVTDADFYDIEDVHSFRLAAKKMMKKKFIVLQKSAIKWIEEN